MNVGTDLSFKTLTLKELEDDRERERRRRGPCVEGDVSNEEARRRGAAISERPRTTSVSVPRIIVTLPARRASADAPRAVAAASAPASAPVSSHFKKEKRSLLQTLETDGSKQMGNEETIQSCGLAFIGKWVGPLIKGGLA